MVVVGGVGLKAVHELLLELGVPVVLDVVVRPPRELCCDDRPPVVTWSNNLCASKTPMDEEIIGLSNKLLCHTYNCTPSVLNFKPFKLF